MRFRYLLPSLRTQTGGRPLSLSPVATVAVLPLASLLLLPLLLQFLLLLHHLHLHLAGTVSDHRGHWRDSAFMTIGSARLT